MTQRNTQIPCFEPTSPETLEARRRAKEERAESVKLCWGVLICFAVLILIIALVWAWSARTRSMKVLEALPEDTCFINQTEAWLDARGIGVLDD